MKIKLFYLIFIKFQFMTYAYNDYLIKLRHQSIFVVGGIEPWISYSIIKDFIVVLTGIDIRIYIRITLNLYKKRIE